MTPITINEIKYSIPSSWQEVSLGQYCDIAANAVRLNPLRMLSIFTGIDYKELINADQDAIGFDLSQLFAWTEVKFNPADLEKKPIIEVCGKQISPPSDPGKKTLGQKLLLQQKIRVAQENESMMCNLIAPAVAIYCQPLIDDSPFDDERAMELSQQVMKSKLVDVYPWGTFFLTGYIRFVPLKERRLQSNTSQKKSKPVSMSSESSMNSGRIIPLQVETSPS